MSFKKIAQQLAKSLLKLLILAYRYLLSPILPPACRFAPTCSEYAAEAIETHGIRKGIKLTIKRLIKCHPWGGSGFDPVP